MFCPSCGTEVATGRKFCGKCGAAVRASADQQREAATVPRGEPSETEPSASAQPASPSSKTAFVIVFFLAILGGVGWWWFHRPAPDYVVRDIGIYPFSMPGLDSKTPKFGFIDADGKILIQPEWDTVEFAYVNDHAVAFSEGFCAVRKDGKWGYIDTSGHLAIPNQFDMAFPFVDGLARVKLGNQIGYIDKTGGYAINPQFDNAGNFQEGLAAVHTDGGWGFIDKAGVLAIKPVSGRTVTLYGFSQGLAPACVGKCGYIDRSGKFAISPQFKSASSFSDGMALVRITTDKWGYINSAGKIVVNPQFDSATGFVGGLAVVSVSGNQGVINKQGKYVINPGQYKMDQRDSDLQQVSTADGIGLMTREGKWVVNPSKALAGIGATMGKVFYGKISEHVVPVSMSGKVLAGWYKGASLDSLAQDIENESSALQSMRALVGAEARYSGLFPAKGFTASLPALGPAEGTPDEDHAGFIDAALATGTKAGYIFTTSTPGGASSGVPNLNYFVVAKPTPGHAGRTFCADAFAGVHYALQGVECTTTSPIT